MMDMDMDRIIFEFMTPHGVFRDALHLPAGHGLTDEQIAEMQRERVNNWLAFVDATSNVVTADEAMSDG
jgi:hypothetical protein